MNMGERVVKNGTADGRMEPSNVFAVGEMIRNGVLPHTDLFEGCRVTGIPTATHYNVPHYAGREVRNFLNIWKR